MGLCWVCGRLGTALFDQQCGHWSSISIEIRNGHEFWFLVVSSSRYCGLFVLPLQDHLQEMEAPYVTQTGRFIGQLINGLSIMPRNSPDFGPLVRSVGQALCFHLCCYPRY